MLLNAAKEIFQKTLRQIDAGEAVRRAVTVDGFELTIGDSRFIDPKLYVIAVGKAAYPMAAVFDEIAGRWIDKGIVSGVHLGVEMLSFGPHWKSFAGGHPLPNNDSLAAARASIELLDEANDLDAVVIFLVSGGGSAMMELPTGSISLAELQSLNQILVTCGATISEINVVRRAVSQVKGGALARLAPQAKQISLIISDTSPGDVSSVASGPSMAPVGNVADADSIVKKYGLASRLPEKVLHVIENIATLQRTPNSELDSRIHVLLDNEFMVLEAANIVKEMGFRVELDREPGDSDIVPGCERLIGLLKQHRRSYDGPVCLISGGEFACKVKGNGIGGRNLETVLRLAMLAENEKALDKWAVLSGGTDGIDGNSPAAGAAADETLLAISRTAGFDANASLEESDSFTFFDRLGGTIITGPTGTNVRDIRILLAN